MLRKKYSSFQIGLDLLCKNRTYPYDNNSIQHRRHNTSSVYKNVGCELCTVCKPNDNCYREDTRVNRDEEMQQEHHERLIERNQLTECYWKSIKELERHRHKIIGQTYQRERELSYIKAASFRKIMEETEQKQMLKNSPFSAVSVKRPSSLRSSSEPQQIVYKMQHYEKKDIKPTYANIRQQKRRFQCLYCEKSFGKSSHLRDHHRTHSGERPFGCRYCGKAFSQFSNLRTHLRIHTGEKPFKCHICEKSFTQRVTLRSHLRTHNPKNVSKNNIST